MDLGQMFMDFGFGEPWVGVDWPQDGIDGCQVDVDEPCIGIGDPWVGVDGFWVCEPWVGVDDPRVGIDVCQVDVYEPITGIGEW